MDQYGEMLSKTCPRESYKILYMDCDRPNIYQQDRRIKKSLTIRLIYRSHHG